MMAAPYAGCTADVSKQSAGSHDGLAKVGAREVGRHCKVPESTCKITPVSDFFQIPGSEQPLNPTITKGFGGVHASF